MRLLRINKDGSLSMVGPFSRQDVPRYAILSHTWGADNDEVTFADFQAGRAESKAGHKKIAFCQRQAAAHRLDYFWIDTCCIDKTSSAELSEAINSMYRWYQGSDRCYVFLQDVSTASGVDTMKMMRSSRWMTRGWTLQELLAPSSVEFFSKEGAWLGTKDSLAPVISEATTISLDALASLTPTMFSRHERMRWVQRRETKVEEDMVYCMLGLFEVSLPLVYGEGRQQALLRLDEALNRRQDHLPQLTGTPFLQVITCQTRCGTRLICVQEKSQTVTNRQSRSTRWFPSMARLEPDVHKDALTDIEKACLRSLAFPCMSARHAEIDAPSPDTSRWLFQHPDYLAWDKPCIRSPNESLLWLKGNPGSGKSVLLKETFRTISATERANNHVVAAHFFNRKGDALERMQLGLFRSIVHQLLLQSRQFLRELCHEIETTVDSYSGPYAAVWRVWTVTELKHVLNRMLDHVSTGPATIIVDAMDECDDEEVRRQAAFWRGIACLDNVRVMISCRHYPYVSTGNSLVIIVELSNSGDIESYVRQRLKQCGQDSCPNLQVLQSQVVAKSRGVFLWVALVLDELLEAFDNGLGLAYLPAKLLSVPDNLALYFDHLLEDIPSAALIEFFAIMSWAVLTCKPLRVDEWYHVMAIEHVPRTRVVSLWRTSDAGIQSDDQLQKRLRASSKGLVEISASFAEEYSETDSAVAWAGSQNSGTGGTRFVQVIHSSVCEHLRRNAKPLHFQNFEIVGHVRILVDCLRYVSLADFDDLVDARDRFRDTARPNQQHKSNVSVSPCWQDTGRYTLSSQLNESSDPVQINLESRCNGNKTVTKHADDQESFDKSQSLSRLDLMGYSHIPLTQGMDDRGGKERHPAASTGHLRNIPSEQRHPENEAGPATLSDPVEQAVPESVITAWLAQLEIDAPTLSECTHTTLPSVPTAAPCSVRSVETSHTRVLKEHMALLPYILTYFWEHARFIQSARLCPHNVIDAFCEPQQWRRWQTLDEQTPYDGLDCNLTELQCAYFHEKGLHSWVQYLGREMVFFEAPVPETNSHSSRLPSSSPWAPLAAVAPEELGSSILSNEGPLRRRGSVASFNSAGSHGSTYTPGLERRHW